MIKLATVFSGIGAIEQALKKLKINHKIVFACDNGEREKEFEKEVNKKYLDSLENIDLKREYVENIYKNLKKKNQMEKSYKANYKIDDSNFFQDITTLNGTLFYKNVDLFVGGSPCQAFSIIGKRGGFNDTRGTLFYEFARLVKEISPKVFIFENVKGMLNHDKGKTWETILNVFEELNYNIYHEKGYVVNSKDYGIPQNRPRIFIIGIRKDLKLKKEFEFPKIKELKLTVKDFYEKEDIEAKYYLGQKGVEFVTNPKYKNRAQVNKDIMMCQKANQQFNWNGDFVFEELSNKHHKEILERAYVTKFENKKGVIRKLTPRECLRLMGFSDDFKIVVQDTHMYRQSGNSIVVNILEEIYKKIEETGVFEC